MEQKTLGNYSGVVKNVSVPKQYKDGRLLDIYETDLIRFEIYIIDLDKTLILTKKSNDKYHKIFKGDKVNVHKYGILYEYETFIKELRQKLELEFCDYTKEDFNKVLDKNLVSINEFKKEPKYIVYYDIS